MAFAEAITRGVPVVGARAGAVPEVVPQQAGILVQPGHVKALARALRPLLESSRRRERLARGAYLNRRRFPDWPMQVRAFAGHFSPCGDDGVFTRLVGAARCG